MQFKSFWCHNPNNWILIQFAELLLLNMKILKGTKLTVLFYFFSFGENQ